jgi:predicted nucleic acid-binding protein
VNIEIRDAALEARLRKQLEATGSGSVEEVLLRLPHSSRKSDRASHSSAARTMTTAIDSNIFIAFWDKNDALNSLAQSALNAAWNRGGLVVAAPVYAKLLAFPGRSEAFLDSFLKDTGITVDWEMDEAIWRTADHVFQSRAARRRRHRDSGPRRILADFLIGAHALRGGYRLLTLDSGLYKAAFPRLTVIAL